MTLTAAQRRELIDMAGRDYRSSYSRSYRPIMALLSLGLVDEKLGKYGTATYAITDAGRAAVEENPEAIPASEETTGV